MSRAACTVMVLAGLCLAMGSSARETRAEGNVVPPAAVITQLDHLVPQRDGRVDLYALVIGGDGREDVFQREVKTVQARLEERLQARGRTVTMVNNRRLPRPEATINSIRYALKRIAETMDTEQDLLFLHITSHGARDHFLVLAHPSQPLSWLGAKEFAAILKQAGIRHRYIVISGCFSGGFIRDLADDNTVVVTAAASTVSSYGCGDQSAITDFSRMFYERALGSSRSLVEVAQLAIQLIHEEEKREQRAHSYPQAHFGANMAAYLRRYEQQRAAPDNAR